MAASLVRISSAARRVNVMARHGWPGGLWPATWLAIRWVSVRVLPVPGPATIISGLSASAAACWSGSRPGATGDRPGRAFLFFLPAGSA